MECFATAIIDVFPTHLRGRPNREIFIAGICIFNFLLGLTMVTEVCHMSNSHILLIFDSFENILVINHELFLVGLLLKCDSLKNQKYFSHRNISAN